jgi:hypothetical protein
MFSQAADMRPHSDLNVSDISSSAKNTSANDNPEMAVSVPMTPSVEREKDEDALFDFDKRPHLLLLPTFNISDAGFAPISLSVGGGLSFEPRYAIVEAIATYDNAHKTNDGTVDNTKGHIRSIVASTFVRMPGYWFVGGETGWDQLSTTNYKKSSRTIVFGGGRDLSVWNTDARIKVSYALPVLDHINGVQGVNFTLYLPSPLRQKRFVYYDSIGLAFFHATITEPNNPSLTAAQQSDRDFAISCVVGVFMRF